MPASDVRSRLDQIAQRFAPTDAPPPAIATGSRSLDILSGDLFSAISLPTNKKTSRARARGATVGNRRFSPQQDVPLTNGWYQIGVIEQPYTADELIRHWRFLWNRTFPSYDPPAFNWYLRKHLTAWLKRDTPQIVEDVFEHVFKQWAQLRRRYGIEIEHPHLGVIYTWRDTFLADMQKATNTRPKKWGAHWRTDADTEAGEEIVRL